MNILELIYYTHTPATKPCDLGWSDDIKLTCMARMLRGISSRYCLMLKCHVLILIRSSKANSRINRPSVHTWECKHSETYDVLKTTSLSHHEEIRFSSERDRMHHINAGDIFQILCQLGFSNQMIEFRSHFLMKDVYVVYLNRRPTKWKFLSRAYTNTKQQNAEYMQRS